MLLLTEECMLNAQIHLKQARVQAIVNMKKKKNIKFETSASGKRLCSPCGCPNEICNVNGTPECCPCPNGICNINGSDECCPGKRCSPETKINSHACMALRGSKS